MISVAKMAKQVEKFSSDNIPTILTAVGTAGVITTAVLSAKGAFKAAEILRLAQADRDIHSDAKSLDKIDKIKLTWMCYVPAVSTGVMTCGAVIGANQINTRRAAALAAAYSLSEKRIDEYRAKVIEKFGEPKEEAVRADLAKDRVEKAYRENKESFIISESEQLFFEDLSGRTFKNTVEGVRAAVNRINHQIHNEGYASLTDFYNEIGLTRTGLSDELGWQLDKLLDVRFTTTLTPDERPAILIEYNKEPIRNYFRMGGE